MNTEENIEITGNFEDTAENKDSVIKKKLERDRDWETIKDKIDEAFSDVIDDDRFE